ncbi:MAG: hypothetical protein ACXU8N_10880 [Telluria sp.]
MKMQVISAPEVAYLLRRELGPLRNWDDTLADMRRGRVEVHGQSLLPTCKAKFAGAWRPMYAVADVVDFIKAVRSADPRAARHAPYQVRIALTEPTDARPWYKRRLLVASVTCHPMARDVRTQTLSYLAA